MSEKSLNYPYGIASDGTKLFVSDSYNHRILVYNSIPNSNYASADLVLGQPDFTSNVANNGGASSSSLYYPYSLHYAGGKLLAVDSENSRVLIWSSAITINNQPADLVIGQPNFTTITGATTNSKLRYPVGVWSDGTKVLVADWYNHRVLAWDTFPVVNGQAANWVLGQTLFTTRTANLGGLSASSLYYPTGVYSDGTMITVADRYNNRVLIWSAWPVANKPSANYVLGQADFVSKTDYSGLEQANTLNMPRQAVITNDQLLVSDNRRFLYFDKTAIASNMNASEVLGQLNFTSLDVNLTSDGVTLSNFVYPTSTATYNGKFLVSDCNRNRVLVWNKIPKDNFESADVVIGQPDASTTKKNNGGVSDKSLSCPWQMGVSDNGRLFVADAYNHRILVFNSIPTTNFASADLVLGQSNFTSNSANGGGARSASSLYNAFYVNVIGQKLIVSDYNNSRVLIWNSLPTVNNQAADLVLGQALFTTGTCGTSNTSLCSPAGSWSNGANLVLSDYSNCRVLVWNTFPTTNNQAADVVIGQPDFTSSSCGTSSSSISYADSLWSDGTKLFVADQSNHRILIWNQLPTVDNTPADKVFGQEDLDSATEGIGQGKLSYPTSIRKVNNHYFITDSNNSRVLAIHEDLFP